MTPLVIYARPIPVPANNKPAPLKGPVNNPFANPLAPS